MLPRSGQEIHARCRIARQFRYGRINQFSGEFSGERTPMIEYDPYDYKFHDDPYPVYRALRDHAPAYHNEKYNFWALSRYHDCQHAVRDFKTFSSAQGTSLEELKAQLPTLINSDPPVHTRLRHLIAGMFTPEKLAPLEGVVRDMARELLAPH